MANSLPLKYLAILAAALLTTALCFWAMEMLVSGRIAAPPKVRPLALAAPVVPTRRTPQERNVRPSQQRVMPAKMPPAPDSPSLLPDIRDVAVTSHLPNFGSTAKEFILDARRFTLQPPMRDLEPLYVVQPAYPFKAMMREIEGYVIVNFGVRDNGTVINPVVLSSSPGTLFDDAALTAITEFRFRPRLVDGAPVPVHNVQLKFVFKLDGSADASFISTNAVTPRDSLRGI